MTQPQGGITEISRTHIGRCWDTLGWKTDLSGVRSSERYLYPETHTHTPRKRQRGENSERDRNKESQKYRSRKVSRQGERNGGGTRGRESKNQRETRKREDQEQKLKFKRLGKAQRYWWGGGEIGVTEKQACVCLTLCDPMDCSPPGSSVHGILQARILEWTAIPFSRGSSQPRG